ncbi:MAG TPA: CvpA family protein [Thermomicrobiales bacterium]|nr:CvpA family protein [Thermomicrobiales bacterium]
MNPIDVVILILVGWFAVIGLRRGFVAGVVDLLTIAVGLLSAARFYRSLVEPLVARGIPREIVAPVAFVILFGGVLLLVSFLVGLLLRPLARLPWPAPVRWADNLLGVVPGAIKGIILAAIVIVPLAFVQGPLGLGAQFAGSRLANPVLQVGLDGLYAGLERFNIDLGDFAAISTRSEEGTIHLPFRVTSGLTADPAAEAQMLRLVNQARADVGLAPLRLDPALTAVARAHSEEMFRLGYFSHDSPTAGDPAARVTAADIPFVLMGENIAWAPTVATAHDGLMNSPGHRANILNAAYSRVGIGIIRSPDRGLMISQEFAS